MQKRRTIIVTGKAGAGKSTVAGILKEFGFEIIDVDQVAHSILNEKKEELVEVFGPEILNKDGYIDRKALGNIVFADPEKFHALEEIVHPPLIEKLKEIVLSQVKDLVLDVAIPYRLRLYSLADFAIVVFASPHIIRERLLKKGWTEEKIESILKKQQEEVIEGKYYLLENDGTINDLENKLFEILRMEGFIGDV
ncbi:MAG TPA: dephospho-CoA kinase [Candidatus Hydrothermia bacterium]|nr:dephospho-CoA kinase [Candidatus Hydrothermae bacterium]MDD3648865.1 dephospho-CoA kinase [Candidatus Hydrothermia bacterium]MDD5572317.1 dephospho-CoA kinase [Candidatus Hydrothermia bacterium]HOK23106.1 dephospho-CoA kinase [Candidatus Hydrothermia bacterium]HOL23810.1 dephospho-CoA kinase [Candidatus Hydrothermia bacterium]